MLFFSSRSGKSVVLLHKDNRVKAKAPALRGFKSLRPFSRGVEHAKNLDPLFPDPIGDDARGMRQHPFTRPCRPLQTQRPTPDSPTISRTPP
jgi:hypothetical protein